MPSKALTRMLAGLIAVSSTAPAYSAPLPETVTALVEKQKSIISELAKPIAACVARRDTDHSAFHGCIDWHSAVHGVWALTAYSRMSGDPQYDGLITSTLAASRVENERRLLKSDPDFEMPYGRAWFLRLVIEDHRRSGGQSGLKAMGDEVFQSLMAHFDRVGANPRKGSYASASWAHINMHAYAMEFGDQDGLSKLTSRIRDVFAKDGQVCDPETERRSFMAICTNWAWLASLVIDKGELPAWLDTFFSKRGLPSPVTAPANWHEYGLNFSRAWGLWALYSATGDARYAEAYAAHFKTAYDEPENWRGSYRGVGHWVAQFGMFAMQPLVEASPKR